MANYIRVSSLSPAPITADGLSGQTAVDKMLQHWRRQLQLVLPDRPDLIVIPEVCDRYADYSFEENMAYYEIRGSQIVSMFADMAKRHNCYITYPADRKDAAGNWYNSLQLLDRNGEIVGIYDKNHLVIEENSLKHKSYGTAAPVFQCDFGTVAAIICFDLNFDELRLQYAAEQPDILLFSSMYHGGLMQPYWAYSCRSFFVGAVSGLPASVIAPNGRLLAAGSNYIHYVTTDINLDCKLVHLDHNMEKFAALKEQYGAGFKIDDTGYLGAVLISSELPELTIDEIIAAGNLELLDSYMQRSLAHRLTQLRKCR